MLVEVVVAAMMFGMIPMGVAVSCLMGGSVIP